MELFGEPVRPSWIVLAAAGVLILAGLPGFWVENFSYWFGTRLLYVIGVALFWWGR